MILKNFNILHYKKKNNINKNYFKNYVTINTIKKLKVVYK